ncbi:MAG: hypothetical protein KJ638_01635 [Chloroflexi bacterium]|nr:hypothetical protein [Chloroflexota bacterium]
MPHKFLLLLIIALTLLLAGCSMSGDVTPPPGYQQPTEAPQSTPTVELPATVIATDEAAPTSAESAPEAESSSEGVGLIRVAVVNGSGSEPPIGAEVVLHGYDEMEEVYARTLVLLEDGVAIFEDVPMPAGRVYLASTQHDQVAYISNLAQITAGTTEASLGITVFDATTDMSVLTIEQLHVFFDFSAVDTIQVVELVLLSNSSEQTLVSPDGETPALVFELPEGAANFGVQESMKLRYLQTENGFGIGSVFPSEEPYEVVFAFEMPYENGKLDLAVPIPLDTTSASVIVPQDGVTVESDQLQDGEVRDFQGVAYQTYSSTDLSMGDTLRFSLSGSPTLPSEQASPDYTDNTADATTDTTSLVIGLGTFGVTLIGAGLYLWFRSRLGTRDKELEEN